ncbi:fasciclin domain-containing protein [Brevundimonas sp.]|uniref:fasciclin domain-containing protein n=1 Tax=Brevundimonas sp. TaxID=1871086 RepID=UPI0035AEEDCE
MFRTKLLTATAVAAIMAAPAAFAQDMTADTAQPPVADETTQDMPATADPAPVTPPAEATAPAVPQEPAAQMAEATPSADGSIISVLRDNGEFTTLLAVLDAAQLTQVIEQDPDITIFAPTDAAFAALPAEELTRLQDPANAQELRQLLLYHVINADVRSEQIEGARGGVPTASGAEVLLDGSEGSIKADAATVTQADLRGSNGAVFVIDQVLSPSNSMASMGDSEGLAADQAAQPTTPPADDDADATDVPDTNTEATTTAPDGSPPAAVTTTSSQPVPNPADTPADQQPTMDNAAPAPTTGEVTSPDTTGTQPVSPTTGAVPPGAPGAPESTAPTDAPVAPSTTTPTTAAPPAGDPMTSDPAASGDTPAAPAATTPPTDDDTDASDEDEDPMAPDTPTV